MDGLFLFSEIYVRKDVFLDMGAKMKENSSLQEEVMVRTKDRLEGLSVLPTSSPKS